MSTIQHFEIPADNLDRAQKFYSELFDWKFSSHQFGEMEYVSIETQDHDGQAGLGGGMMLRQNPGQQPVNYVTVKSVDDSVSKAQTLGAKVLVEKQTVPEWAILPSVRIQRAMPLASGK